MKRLVIFVLALAFTFSLVGCDQKSGPGRPIMEPHEEQLSLAEVRQLAEKGEDLSWDDFEQYKHEDIGSGLHIFLYDIDEKYCLLIGGGEIQTPPMYIRLVCKADNSEFIDDGVYIDIRTENVDDFINSNN